MKRQSLRLWVSAIMVCAAAMSAERSSGEEFRSEPPHLITADHLFTESDPWIQTVSLQCAAESPCGEVGDSCGETVVLSGSLATDAAMIC
ncbi:MAG TPA: hypothetical protein EYG03_25640 [Planctomycetes bacterium]|nr:hypothetical protein [Planctomycetota bacterium]